MAIFGELYLESIVQVSDKTRLDATPTYVTKDEAAISQVEIEPEAGAGFVDVTGASGDDWFLDYQYATDGTKTVSLRVTTDGAPQTFTKTLEVLTAADDKLFSNDGDLVRHEPDILKWVPRGRNSFLNIHRRAQELCLTWLDEQGYTDSDGARLTKAAVIDIEEIRQWSTFVALRLIHEGISNKVDDVFAVKAKEYEKWEFRARNRSVLRLDLNGDGEVSTGEYKRITSTRMIRS